MEALAMTQVRRLQPSGPAEALRKAGGQEGMAGASRDVEAGDQAAHRLTHHVQACAPQNCMLLLLCTAE